MALSPDEVSLPSRFDVELALTLVMVMYYERRRFMVFLYDGVHQWEYEWECEWELNSICVDDFGFTIVPVSGRVDD